MMIGQEVTTQAFGSLPRRQSAGRGLEEAANAGGTTLQSKHHWKESAFQPLQFGADGTVGQGGRSSTSRIRNVGRYSANHRS